MHDMRLLSVLLPYKYIQNTGTHNLMELIVWAKHNYYEQSNVERLSEKGNKYLFLNIVRISRVRQ